MKNLKDKEAFILIIILLLVFLPFSIYGTVKKIQVFRAGENPNKEHFKNGHLYFYDNKLYLGKYKCISEKCDFAKSVEETENINYYTEGKKEYLPIIKKKYAFINDNNKILLYDINLARIVIEMDAIKFYNQNIENNVLLIQKDNRWGVISLDNMAMVINYNYDYLGLVNRMENNLIKSDKMIASNASRYYLIDNRGTILSTTFSASIHNFNENYIVTKSGRYNIYNYQGVQFLEDFIIDDIKLTENYVGVVRNKVLYIYKKLSEAHLDNIPALEYKTINLIEKEKNIDVYIDGKLTKSVATDK